MTCHAAPGADPAFDALISRVRAEFREMPGLQLTPPQFSRLFGVPPPTCPALIEALIDHHVVRRTRKGAYVRVEWLP